MNKKIDFKELRKAEQYQWYRIDGSVVAESEIGTEIPAFHLRRLRPFEMRQPAQKSVFAGRRSSMVDDPEKQRLNWLSLCMDGWRNVFDDGNPVPFTEQNAVYLDQQSTEFAALWMTVASDGGPEGEAEKEKARGN